jgi:hypothetical protein
MSIHWKWTLRQNWPALATAMDHLTACPDLVTLLSHEPRALDEAWSAAWRPSLDVEPGQSREERADAAWAIYRRWTQES